jgi:hypothetical protein
MKAGDLVKIRCTADDSLIGIVTWISMQYPPICGILIDGKLEVEDLRVMEVISESW